VSNDHIKPGDRLRIEIRKGFPEANNDAVLVVEASGKIALDPVYGGRIEIDGMTLEDAEASIKKRLSTFLKNPLVQLTRADPVKDDDRIAALEARIRVLETAVSKLSDELAGLRKK
jgi:protein involved in polysaccharide export with SLBB domain